MKKVIFPLALCLITAACGGDENDGKTEPEMKISSCYVVSSSSGQSENFSSPVGMYITSEAGQPYEGSGVWSASYKSGAWAMDKPVYVTKAGKVYAYYPYSSNDSPPVLPLDMTKQTDVLYSRVAFPIAPGSVSLSVKLYHALSKLVVSVKGEEVTGLSLSSPVTCRFNISTGEFTDLQSGQVASTGGRLFVVPHVTVGKEMLITLKSGKQYTYSVDGTEFRAGESYTYEFQLNEDRDKLEILDISVEDWINDNNYNDYLRR